MNCKRFIYRVITTIVFGAVIVLNLYAQSTWERFYGLPDRGEKVYSVVNTYDGGFLYGIYRQGEVSNQPGTWLLKTDINGYPLWSKYFIGEDFTFLAATINENESGEIFLTGQSNEFDLSGNPLLMKLNACGEKIWCKYLSFPNTNYGYHILFLPNGNIVWHTYLATNNWLQEYNQLWWVDTNGCILSCAQIIPHVDYPNLIAPFFYDIIQTNDEGFLCSGYCYFPQDTTNPQGITRLQHLVVKADSVGNEEWVIPDTLNLNQTGVLISLTEHADFYYTSGFTREAGPKWQPYLGKYNYEGQLEYNHILHSDTLFSILVGLIESNDTFYYSSECFYGSYDPIFTGMFKTDTLGNIIAHLQNKTGSPRGNAFVQAKDNKFLIGGYAPYDYNEFYELDAWSMKVNENLEYDTLYTFPFVYDSLCPFHIPTDTIDCDCDLITGFGEPISEEELYRLHIYPNPVDEIVQVRLHDITGADDNKGKKLIMYDLLGRKVTEKTFTKEVYIDVGGKPPGIYIFVVEQDAAVIAREKLIVL